jgi:hypothetical protein
MSVKRRFCAVCKCEIPAERIETDPNTRLCAKHALEIEKHGGEFLRTGEYVSLGKPGSIKQNLGDVTVTSKRNQEGLSRLLDDYDREMWERKGQQGS